MAHLKRELLEHIIRESICEILDQTSVRETVGAASPPADGLGTADQPAIPNKPSFTEKKLKKEWIDTKNDKPVSKELNELKMAIKGIVREVFLNGR